MTNHMDAATRPDGRGTGGRLGRRTVLVGASLAAIGMAASQLAPRRVSAAPAVRIRASSGSAEGKQALLTYRSGVAVMRQRSAAAGLDPTGWLYQVLIHGIVFNVPKQQLIDSAFQGVPASDPQRQLAEGCWDTCPHGLIEFLAWHRIYLFDFERIVRGASGEANFAMPYWDYSSGAANAQIPAELREAVGASPFGNALFDLYRDPGMNGLNGPPSSLLPSDVALDALTEATFEATPDASGFSAAVENIPHNVVHGATGGSDDFGIHSGDMSFTSTAGYDPIFWLHHANMDRLWESWLRAGNETAASYKDRPWYNTKWTFADETGARQDVSLADLDAILEQEPIEYDRYEQIPRNAPVAVAAASSRVTIRGAESLTIPPQGARVEFGLPQDNVLRASPNVSLDSAKLVLENVVADSEVATTFDVYFNLASSNEPEAEKLIGSFNFFGAAHAGQLHAKRYIFDITRKVRDLRAVGGITDKLSVSILPRKRFLGQTVKVGAVDLVVE